MNSEERIAELDKEIKDLIGESDKRRQQIQELQFELQQINEAILTRRGGIIELQKLVAEGNTKIPIDKPDVLRHEDRI